MRKHMYTGIVILQYGGEQLTIDCIESVERYNTAPVKVIVVDNCSPRVESVERIAKYLKERFEGDFIEVVDGERVNRPLPRAVLVRSAVNDGYARGNNKGLALAYGDDEIDKVLILNNDILFVEDIIPKLREDIDRLPECGLITPLLYKRDMVTLDPNCARHEGRVRDTLAYNFMILKVTERMKRAIYIPLSPGTGLHGVELVSGSCIMSDKTFMASIGGFDPATFLYQEENILWERVKRAGRRDYVDTDLKCVHLGAQTIKSTVTAKMLRRMLKSEYYFVRKYGGRWALPKAAMVKLSQWWVLSAFGVRDILRTITGWKRSK